MFAWFIVLFLWSSFQNTFISWLYAACVHYLSSIKFIVNFEIPDHINTLTMFWSRKQLQQLNLVSISWWSQKVIAWLILYCFSSRFRIFYSNSDDTISGDVLKSGALWPLSSERFFNLPCYDTGPRFLGLIRMTRS